MNYFFPVNITTVTQFGLILPCFWDKWQINININLKGWDAFELLLFVRIASGNTQKFSVVTVVFNLHTLHLFPSSLYKDPEPDTVLFEFNLIYNIKFM